jgi:hypothetical protein
MSGDRRDAPRQTDQGAHRTELDDVDSLVDDIVDVAHGDGDLMRRGRVRAQVTLGHPDTPHRH